MPQIEILNSNASDSGLFQSLTRPCCGKDVQGANNNSNTNTITINNGGTAPQPLQYAVPPMPIPRTYFGRPRSQVFTARVAPVAQETTTTIIKPVITDRTRRVARLKPDYPPKPFRVQSNRHTSEKAVYRSFY